MSTSPSSSLLPLVTRARRAPLLLALSLLGVLGASACSDRPGARSPGPAAPAPSPAAETEPTQCDQCGHHAAAAADPAPQAPQALRVELGTAPVRGPADAPVTIVEFGDYECGFCVRAAETLQRLQAEFPGKIRIVWKDFPLPIHPNARALAAAARAAAAQGRFWELHERLITPASQRLTGRERLEQAAQSAGLALPRLRAAFDESSDGAGIDADIAQGKQLGVRGTPTLFINGVIVTGAQPIETFRAQVTQALKQAEAQLARGTRPTELYAQLMREARPGPAPTSAVSDEPERPRQAVVLGEAPTRGPASAQVTLVVFSDFECPFCSRMAQTLKELEGEFAGRLRIAWKAMPLGFHPHAEPAARAALAAAAQGRFWEMHDRLFAHITELTDADLERHAAAVGLDLGRFRTDLQSPRIGAQIQGDRQQATTLGVSGTPTLFINGKLVRGALPLPSLRATIEEELRAAR